MLFLQVVKDRSRMVRGWFAAGLRRCRILRVKTNENAVGISILRRRLVFRGYKDRDGKTVMDKEYLDHAIFKSLSEASKFYHNLAENVVNFVPKWVSVHPIVNYDSYFFEALANSILSIKAILELGHITDAKALLRNLFDETIVNLYFMARLKKKDDEIVNSMTDANFLIQRLQPEQLYDINVSDWLTDNKTKTLQKALHYDEMRDFLKQEVCIAEFVEYLESSECKKMREWLNDAVHLNYYKAILLNDGRLGIDGLRKATIDEFKCAFDQIVMFHATCLFCLEPAYMMSSKYFDYKDCGMKPPDGCQYDVAPFVQSFLDKTVYKASPDWARKLVKTASPMRLRKMEEVRGCNDVGLVW